MNVNLDFHEKHLVYTLPPQLKYRLCPLVPLFYNLDFQPTPMITPCSFNAQTMVSFRCPLCK